MCACVQGRSPARACAASAGRFRPSPSPAGAAVPLCGGYASLVARRRLLVVARLFVLAFACLFVCLCFVCLLVCLFVCLFVCLVGCLRAYLFVCFLSFVTAARAWRGSGARESRVRSSKSSVALSVNEPSPGADVGGVDPVSGQMWQAEPSASAVVAAVGPLPVQM